MDLLSNFLVLGIGIIAVGLRNNTNPANIGIVLTYTLSVVRPFHSALTSLDVAIDASHGPNHHDARSG